jgi:hypothetical protein
MPPKMMFIALAVANAMMLCRDLWLVLTERINKMTYSDSIYQSSVSVVRKLVDGERDLLILMFCHTTVLKCRKQMTLSTRKQGRHAI